MTPTAQGSVDEVCTSDFKDSAFKASTQDPPHSPAKRKERSHPGSKPGEPLKPRRKRVFLTLAILGLLGAGAGVWWKSQPHSGSIASLEPTQAVAQVPIPVPLRETSTAGGLIQAAVAAANGTSVAVNAVKDTLGSVREGLNQIGGRVEKLEASDTAQNQQITGLRTDVARIDAKQQEMLASATAASAAAAQAASQATVSRPRLVAHTPSARPPRRVAHARKSKNTSISSASPSANKVQAEVLAVDIWGDKPSVVVSRTGSGGTELRFLNEGEGNGRVQLKRADVGTQSATFATPGGEQTLNAVRP
jgi:TolA-binding protein